MKKPNHNLALPVGNVSHDEKLGKYYQDFTAALFHYENKYFGEFDKDGIPMAGFGDGSFYNQIYIIQYGLIAHDLILDGIDTEINIGRLKKCLDWLESNKEKVGESIVWRNYFADQKYELKPGWISAMYQGQAISLFLRAYQFFGTEKYYEIAGKAFEFFKYDFSDGGVKRLDEKGFLWFEEYPTEKPSFVLNGYIYTLFGIYDFYRVSKSEKAKNLYAECIATLENNLYKYDVWYWSLYDQLKRELVSYYYQKNIHIPLMEIMHRLTGKEIFRKYAVKWTKNYDSGFNKLIVQLMYRVHPRLKRWIK